MHVSVPRQIFVSTRGRLYSTEIFEKSRDLCENSHCGEPGNVPPKTVWIGRESDFAPPEFVLVRHPFAVNVMALLEISSRHRTILGVKGLGENRFAAQQEY